MQALFLLNHLAVHLDRLGRASADLDQDRRLKVAALYIMLDAISVFARSELRKRPFPRIQAIALLLHLDLIGARLVGDLEQLLEQEIGALFSRARVHVGKVLAPNRASGSLSGQPISTPMRRIRSPCCARAASGHAAAAPPSSVMKSRRLLI